MSLKPCPDLELDEADVEALADRAWQAVEDIIQHGSPPEDE